METSTWVGDVHISTTPSLFPTEEERRAMLASVPAPSLPADWWGRFELVTSFAECLSPAARWIYGTTYKTAVLMCPQAHGGVKGIFPGFIAKRIPEGETARCLTRLAATFNLLVEQSWIGYGMLHRTALFRLDAPMIHPTPREVAELLFELRAPVHPARDGLAVLCVPFINGGGPERWQTINDELGCALFAYQGAVNDADGWDRLPG